jgi:hypothetical protein
MRSRTRVDRSNDRTSELGIILAISSIATGVIHAGVVPEHLEETALFGFFILAAAFEIAWAMAVLFRPAVIVYTTISALANGATIGIWLLSRTIGLPIGPEPWMPEPMQSLDVAATSLELLLVVGSGALLSRHMHAKVRGTDLDERAGVNVPVGPFRGVGSLTSGESSLAIPPLVEEPSTGAAPRACRSTSWPRLMGEQLL